MVDAVTTLVRCVRSSGMFGIPTSSTAEQMLPRACPDLRSWVLSSAASGHALEARTSTRRPRGRARRMWKRCRAGGSLAQGAFARRPSYERMGTERSHGLELRSSYRRSPRCRADAGARNADPGEGGSVTSNSREWACGKVRSLFPCILRPLYATLPNYIRAVSANQAAREGRVEPSARWGQLTIGERRK